MYVCNYVYLNGKSSQFADERNNTQPTTFIKYQNFPLNKYMNTKYKSLGNKFFIIREIYIQMIFPMEMKKWNLNWSQMFEQEEWMIILLLLSFEFKWEFTATHIPRHTQWNSNFFLVIWIRHKIIIKIFFRSLEFVSLCTVLPICSAYEFDFLLHSFKVKIKLIFWLNNSNLFNTPHKNSETCPLFR